MRFAPLATLLALLLVGCDDASSSSTATGGSTSSSNGTTSSTSDATSASSSTGGPTADFTIGGDRPTTVFLPTDYDPAKPAPVLILLHGYGATGAIQDAYLGVKAAAAAHGMLYAHPDGLVDPSNKQFWNATDACCNFANDPVDDSAYLIGLVNEIKTKALVDPKRVYFFGHSNGGFMSHRLACDHAGDVAAIASLAGAMFDDPTKCKPSDGVAVLQIHGTMDETIAYGGGTTVTTYPSANETIMDWVGFNGCDTMPDLSKPDVDLEAQLAGNETKIQSWGTSCKPGGHAELWTIDGGKHIPVVSATFTETVIQFLLAHPKP